MLEMTGWGFRVDHDIFMVSHRGDEESGVAG